MNGDDLGRLAYLVLLLAAVGGWVMVEYRQRLGQAETANGVVRTARILLDRMVLGPFEDRDVTAFVNEAAMQGSLLGMDYLGRFSIQIAGDRMILTR